VPSLELRVPGDHPSIQAAIDAAEDGDVVVVSPGTYAENIDFRGKNITVRSAEPDDPDVVASTIIDGQGSGTVVTFQSGEAGQAVLTGFTIKNGELGISVTHGSSPTISLNTITEIAGQKRDLPVLNCGIFVTGNAGPTITGNTISHNRGFLSGGIVVTGASSPMIAGNTIDHNTGMMGAGLYVSEGSSPTVTGNTIESNSTVSEGGWGPGGGIAVLEGAAPTIQGNVIRENEAIVGGGIYLLGDASPTVSENVFANNQAYTAGGAIYASSGSTLNLSDPDDNTYVGNTPDDVRYE
jgi:parallel beta-helix repeat protein/predicted outer membrane repeat protein